MSVTLDVLKPWYWYRYRESENVKHSTYFFPIGNMRPKAVYARADRLRCYWWYYHYNCLNLPRYCYRKQSGSDKGRGPDRWRKPLPRGIK